MRDVVRAQRHRHVLRLAEDLITPGAALAAGAGSLGAAEGLAQVAHVLAVDEAHARLYGSRHAMGPAYVLGPDVAGQAVLDVVGLGNRIRLVLERNQAGHWTEDLFLGDAHAVVHV